jgi:hypothetical protein
MGRERAQRGRHDHGERSADREMHADGVVDPERAERLVQDRHQNAAAADAEQPREQPGDKPRGQQRAGQSGEVARRHAQVHRHVP